MDKRKNKILVGCLALLLVMAVGYALFSENITINGTATAKGEFKLTTTCGIVPQEDITKYYSNLQYIGVSKNEISCEDNDVSISTTLDYPGAYAWYKIVVKNEGSIKARLKNIEIVESGNILDETSTGDNLFYLEPISIYITPSELGDEVYEDYYEQINIPRSSFDDYDFTDRLPSGKTFVYYIRVVWESTDTTQRPEGVTSNYTFKFNYEQATN